MDLIHPRCRLGVYLSYGTICLGLYTSLHPNESLKIFGRTVLIVIGYATVNDIFGCYRCIEYWTLGHWNHGISLQPRLVRSLNPILNAIIWGPFVSWFFAIPIGLYITFLCRIEEDFLYILTFNDIAPSLLGGSGMLLLLAQVYSRIIQKKVGIWESISRCNLLGYLGGTLGIFVYSIYLCKVKVSKIANYIG